MSARFLQRADMLKVLKECQVERVRVGGSSIEEFHHLRLTIAVHAQASVRGVWRGEVAHQGGDALGAVLHSGYATLAPLFVRLQCVVDRPRRAGADAVNPVDAGRRRHAHCAASSCGADHERREIRRQSDAMQIFEIAELPQHLLDRIEPKSKAEPVIELIGEAYAVLGLVGLQDHCLMQYLAATSRISQKPIYHPPPERK